MGHARTGGWPLVALGTIGGLSSCTLIGNVTQQAVLHADRKAFAQSAQFFLIRGHRAANALRVQGRFSSSSTERVSKRWGNRVGKRLPSGLPGRWLTVGVDDHVTVAQVLIERDFGDV